MNKKYFSFIKNLFVAFVFSISLFGSFIHVSAQEDTGLVVCGGYYADGTPQEDCDFDHLVLAADKLIDFLLFTLAMPLSALLFAYAGYLYLFSSVSDKKSQAKKIFWNVLWGLVIALSAWLIVNTFLTGFSVDENLKYLGS